MNELKPCPFCGSNASIIYVMLKHSPWKLYKAYCTRLSCNARTTEKKLKREAVELWNRRIKSE